MNVGIVGCGVMGSAMARIIKGHEEIFLYTRHVENIKDLAKEQGVTLCTSIEEIGNSCDAVVLAVKPKDLEEIAEELDPVLQKGTLLLSILVGTPLYRLRSYFSNPKVFRLLPNIPLLCGMGLIGVADEEEVLAEDKRAVDQILKGLGTTVWLDEGLMNPFAALTGSSPAFIYLIIEAMIQAGITVGFKSAEAKELVLRTIEGSVALLRHTGAEVSEARNAVSSPGGTTIAGLNEMERLNVRHGVISGVLQTLERGKEMEE
jgi:pyrroline-5-carboxylate reductase